MCQFAGPWGHPFAGSWGQGDGANNLSSGCLRSALESTVEKTGVEPGDRGIFAGSWGHPGGHDAARVDAMASVSVAVGELAG
jgi:hypothetical protein